MVYFFEYVFLGGGCNIIKCLKYVVCYNVFNGIFICVCLKKDDCVFVVKLVCGIDGKIYINECFMKVIVCEKREDMDKRKDGVCGEMRVEFIYKKSLVIFLYVILLKEILDFGCLSCFNRV